MNLFKLDKMKENAASVKIWYTRLLNKENSFYKIG